MIRISNWNLGPTVSTVGLLVRCPAALPVALFSMPKVGKSEFECELWPRMIAGFEVKRKPSGFHPVQKEIITPRWLHLITMKQEPVRENNLMEYRLVESTASDADWLETLRRSVYQDLFRATWGGWDEARHQRHLLESLRRGHISIIEVDRSRVGMIQFFNAPDVIEVGEIQIQPQDQNRGIGTTVLLDIIAVAHNHGKSVSLAVGLKNEKAFRLYRRLGFRQVAETETHCYMACEPKR